jgi:beta-lactam-binding protein with PASTA domain
MRRAVVLALVVSALGASAASQGRSSVAVPSLANTNLKRAIVRIHRAALRVTIPSAFYLASNSTPEVVRQTPEIGANVSAGSAVVLQLAQPPTVAPVAGTRPIRVPVLKGLRLTYAVKRLEGAGLHFWTVQRVPPLRNRDERSLFGAYRVTGQHPTAGTILRQRRQVGGSERIVPVALSVRMAPQRR